MMHILSASAFLRIKIGIVVSVRMQRRGVAVFVSSKKALLLSLFCSSREKWEECH